MSRITITNQKDLRAAFWEESALFREDLPRRKIGRGADRDYPTNTRVAFVDYVDAMQKSGKISEKLAQRATLGGLEGNMNEYGEGQMVSLGEDDDLAGFGIGTPQPLTLPAAVPALIGGGSAVVVAAGVRGLAPVGSFLTKHAGGIGAVGGAAIALLTKQGGSGVAAALLVGVAIEGIEYLTRLKLTAAE